MKKQIDIPDLITDDFIINIFKLKNTKNSINPSRTKKVFLNHNPLIKCYLINRFNDSDSIYESIYRIFHNIEYKPLCKNCGKPLIFSRTHGFRKYCSSLCVQNNKDIKLKKKETRNKNIKEYKQSGFDFYQEVNNKRYQTCLNKYGTKYPQRCIEIKEKIKQTNIKRFGVPYTAQNKSCIEKMKQTCLEKYGVDHNFKISEVQQHIKETWLEKYGCENPMQNKEILQKNYNTKKRNNSFKQSKSEEYLYEYLCSKYNKDDVIRQYNSIEYPFNCDFYIKSLNLYIELQGFWTHGNHPFNCDNMDDINRLNMLKEKQIDKPGYANAIEVWTIRDVNKRNTAKQNNLNYLEIFANKKEDMINIFEDYIKQR